MITADICNWRLIMLCVGVAVKLIIIQTTSNMAYNTVVLQQAQSRPTMLLQTNLHPSN